MNKTLSLLVGTIIVIALAMWGLQALKIFPFTQPTTEDTNQTEVVTPTPETNTSPSYTLTFGTTTVVIKRASDGNVDQTFWNMQPTTVSINGDLTSLYNREDWWNYLFYDTPKQTYYELEPGGNEQLSLVNEQYIKKKTAEVKTDTDDLSQTKMQKTCTSKKISVGNLTNVWSVSCTTTASDIASNDVLDSNTVTECYVPVGGTSSYLAYEIPLLPAGSTVNLCDTIQEMKITSISKLAQ